LEEEEEEEEEEEDGDDLISGQLIEATAGGWGKGKRGKKCGGAKGESIEEWERPFGLDWRPN
jgi:hypothetical protein